jgi:hypothetical protein
MQTLDLMDKRNIAPFLLRKVNDKFNKRDEVVFFQAEEIFDG